MNASAPPWQAITGWLSRSSCYAVYMTTIKAQVLAWPGRTRPEDKIGEIQDFPDRSIVEIRRAASAVNHLVKVPPFNVTVDHPDIFPLRNFLALQVRADVALRRTVNRISSVSVVPNVGQHRGIDVTGAGWGEVGASRQGAAGKSSHWDTARFFKGAWS